MAETIDDIIAVHLERGDPAGMVADVRAFVDAQERELADLRARLAACEAALRAIEWINELSPPGSIDPFHDYEQCCPTCDRAQPKGHAPDCVIGRALSLAGGA